jgi:hypothetical protein
MNMKRLRFGIAPLAALGLEAAGPTTCATGRPAARACQCEVVDGAVKLVLPERTFERRASMERRDGEGSGGTTGELDAREKARRRREQEWLKAVLSPR